MRWRGRSAASLTVMASLAGCNAMQPGGDITTRPAMSQAMRATTRQNLYVLNSNDVTVYAPGQVKPLRTISKQMDAPSSMALDGSGTLYVLNYAGGAAYVTEYAPGTDKVTARFTPNVENAYYLNVDASRRLYVSGSFEDTGSVAVYDGTRLLRTLTQQIFEPEQIAFDSSQRAYVMNDPNDSIPVYTPSGKLQKVIQKHLSAVQAEAFDTSGNLYVANCARSCFYGRGRAASIAIFAGGTGSFKGSIEDGISDPVSLAFDPSGNLYALNYKGFAPYINIYPPGATEPAETISSGLYQAVYLTTDTSGTLYVANRGLGSVPGYVTVYPAGETQPSLTITKGVTSPSYLAFGP